MSDQAVKGKLDETGSPLTPKILRFIKVEHTAFSLPLLFAGAWIGTEGQTPSMKILLLIVVAAVGARIFGMSFNRIFDRQLDAQNPRTAARELPSGALSMQTAMMVAFGGLLVYLMACAALGGWCLTLAVIPLIPLFGYSLLKRFTPLCHFGIGLCLSLAPLGAYVAATDRLDFPLPAILFSFFVFCWMSSSDIIYALLDIESDRKNKVHSLPAKLGERGALRVAALSHLAALGCVIAVFLLTDGGGTALAALGLAAAAIVAMYLPIIPVGFRFFPISTIAGIAAALVPVLGRY